MGVKKGRGRVAYTHSYVRASPVSFDLHAPSTTLRCQLHLLHYKQFSEPQI